MGKVFLELGLIVFASINELEEIPPDTAVYRILAWRHGTFYMEPVDKIDLPLRIEMSAVGALMEGMRIVDEVARYDLPSMRARVRVQEPLRARLRDLTPDELEVFQAALNHRRLEAVFNNCGLDDIDIATALRGLIDRSYLEVTDEN
jgi:hypothetical protein